MKLNITSDPSKSISGYKNIFVVNNDNFDVSGIVNNCCSEIICNAIDYIPYGVTENLLKAIILKLRLGGSLIVTGLNFDNICRYYISDTISEKDVSDMLEHIKSVRSRNRLCSFLKSLGLTIEYSISKGNIYEISATRTA